MKFGSLTSIKAVLPGLLLCIVLTGCATSGGRSASQVGSTHQSLVIKETLRYLPKRTVSEETGKYIPYVASANPYTAQKGKIDKASVINFIDAKRAVKRKQHKQAKLILLKMTQADKSLSGPWVLLGEVAQQEKKSEDALEHYQRAIVVNKQNVNAFLKLAKLQRKLGMFVKAQNTYEQALRVWKDFPEAHLNLAVLYDVYLNQPLNAQRHMEAYQFLTQGKNKTVGMWLNEIQQRTGEKMSLTLDNQPESSVSLSAEQSTKTFAETVNQVVVKEASL